MKKAADVMIPLDSYPHIPYWFTIRQAVAELEKAEFDVGGRKSLPRCVLVFNEAYELLGMVRRRDILRGMDPESLANIILPRLLGKASGSSHPKLSKGIRDRLQRPVSDVMRPIKDSVDHDDSIIGVACAMVDRNLSFVPVMKDNKVVGVARTVEVIRELVHASDIQTPGSENT
ncbi:MAG: CBS domain-containing protein [Elusimicrobiota bacterium]